MLNNVINVIKSYNLIEKNDKIIVGVSGGPDSMCLLNIFYKIMSKKLLGFSFDIIVCHINHGTRNGQSDEDAKFVREYVENINLPFYLYSYKLEDEANKLNMSQEEAGRYLRYNAFREVKEKVNGTKIATAHNLDDNVETVFLNLIRGTGLSGLTGIKIQNEDIIRPLLGCEKKDILKYIEEEDIPYKVDYTNAGIVYTRNKIRNQIIPLIKEEINPNLLSSIDNTINLLSFDNQYIEKIAIQEYEKIKKINEIKDGLAILPLKEFNNLELAIKRRVLRYAIKEVNDGSLKDISLCYIDSIIKLVPGKEINLPFSLHVICNYDDIRIYKINNKTDNINDKQESETINQEIHDEILIDDYSPKSGKFVYSFKNEYMSNDFHIELNYEIINIENDKVENRINIEKIKNNQDEYVAYYDINKIRGNVVIRNRKIGDKITIDLNGHTKKVKDILIDKKVNKKEREYVLVIEDSIQKNNNEEGSIMSILGYRWNPNYKVDENTKKVLKIWQIM